MNSPSVSNVKRLRLQFSTEAMLSADHWQSGRSPPRSWWALRCSFSPSCCGTPSRTSFKSAVSTAPGIEGKEVAGRQTSSLHSPDAAGVAGAWLPECHSFPAWVGQQDTWGAGKHDELATDSYANRYTTHVSLSKHRPTTRLAEMNPCLQPTSRHRSFSSSNNTSLPLRH